MVSSYLDYAEIRAVKTCHFLLCYIITSATVLMEVVFPHLFVCFYLWTK